MPSRSRARASGERVRLVVRSLEARGGVVAGNALSQLLALSAAARRFDMWVVLLFFPRV